MDILLKKFILNLSQVRQFEPVDNPSCRHPINEQSEQRIGSHVHQKQVTHGELVLCVFEDYHREGDTDGSLETTVCDY